MRGKINRKLTEQEKDWLIRGLKTLETGEYRGGGKWRDGKTGKVKPLDEPRNAEPFLRQIDEIRVVYKCECSEFDCHTIRFQNFERGRCSAMITSWVEDGRMLIIDIHRETQLLAGLEII